MGNGEAEGEFKVTDRRRRGGVDESAPPSPPAGPPPPGPVSERGGPQARPQPAEPSPGRIVAPGEPPAPERSLTGLFMMLASSAVVALGDTPDPVTGERHRDLEQAAEAIDLLVLLRERTSGNLTPQETQVLDQLIYDLQLRYVNARRRSG